MSNLRNATGAPITTGYALYDDNGKPVGGLTHKCRAYRNSTQSISNTTSTNVLFDAESYDTDSYHSTSVNTDRITVPPGLGGVYLLTASVIWDSNATGYRQCIIKRYNSSGVIQEGWAQDTRSALANTQHYISHVSDLASSGDYFVLEVWQNSTATRTVAQYTMLSAFLLG